MIDASTVAKYILREENWLEVEEYLLKDRVLSLDIMLKEVLNAIWKHHVLLRNIGPEIAYSKKNILQRLIKESVIEIEDQRNYLDEAFDPAVKEKITIYDSLYIVQALRNELKLLTSDERQAEITKKYNVETIFIP